METPYQITVSSHRPTFCLRYSCRGVFAPAMNPGGKRHASQLLILFEADGVISSLACNSFVSNLKIAFPLLTARLILIKNISDQIVLLKLFFNDFHITKWKFCRAKQNHRIYIRKEKHGQSFTFFEIDEPFKPEILFKLRDLSTCFSVFGLLFLPLNT